MPDEMDQVQIQIEQFQHQALADATREMNRLPSRVECLDCEEPIPETRRLAVPGCPRCVQCQTDFENITDNWRPI